MLKYRKISFLILCHVFAMVAIACPGTYGAPKWPFSNTIAVDEDDSSLVTGINNAVGDWNSAQSLISIQITDDWLVIIVSDDTSIAPNLGETQVYSQAYDTSCYMVGELPAPLCFTSSVAYYATVKLNPDGIASTASTWSLSTDVVAEKVMSHELGHVFDLDDDTGSYSCDSPTIMNSAAPYFCHFNTPQSCDVSEFLSAYSGWTFYTWTLCQCSGSCS